MKLTANNRLLIVRHFKAGHSMAECAETYGKTVAQVEQVVRVRLIEQDGGGGNDENGSLRLPT